MFVKRSSSRDRFPLPTCQQAYQKLHARRPAIRPLWLNFFFSILSVFHFSSSAAFLKETPIKASLKAQQQQVSSSSSNSRCWAGFSDEDEQRHQQQQQQQSEQQQHKGRNLDMFTPQFHQTHTQIHATCAQMHETIIVIPHGREREAALEAARERKTTATTVPVNTGWSSFNLVWERKKNCVFLLRYALCKTR